MNNILLLFACVCWLLSEIWIFSRDKGKLQNAKDRNSRIFVMSFACSGIILAFLSLYYQQFSFHQTSFVIIGVALMIAGILFRRWSVLTLGKYFRTKVLIQHDHKVIQTGPYRLIRHPSYTGSLITDLGFALSLGNWLGLFFALVFPLIGFLIRISVEEKELSGSLGQEYKNYIQHTKKLIPFVY